MRTLLLEDDADLARALVRMLERGGHAVDRLSLCAEARTALDVQSFDLVVLDLTLPDGDGVGVLDHLRQRRPDAASGTQPDVPVLVLSARDAIEQRVVALDHGADDYVVKPFAPEELLARLRVLRRRAAGRSEPVFRAGPLSLDPARRLVRLGDSVVELSAREFDVLHVLIEAQGKVVSRDRLEERLYGWERPVESNTIEVYIHNLRRKLGVGWIRTLRGVGYVLQATEGP